MTYPDYLAAIPMHINMVLIFFIFYYIGKALNTTNSKRQKSSLIKCSVFSILVFVVAIIFLLMYPDDRAEVVHITVMSFVIVFLLCFLYLLLREIYIDSKTSKVTEGYDNPIPLFFIFVFMFAFVLVFGKYVLGWW